MIARANFDDRDALIGLLERRASEDFASLGCTESEGDGEETEPDEDEFVSSEAVRELADDLEDAEDDGDASDSNDSEDIVAPEEHEWTPECLSDVSDYEDDGAWYSPKKVDSRPV